MQLLALRGFEETVCDGLGLIDGTVRQINPNCVSIRVPHIGWNEINRVKESKIIKYEPGHSFMYFNHSYALVPEDSKIVVALTDHGGSFVCSRVGERFWCPSSPRKKSTIWTFHSRKTS